MALAGVSEAEPWNTVHLSLDPGEHRHEPLLARRTASAYPDRLARTRSVDDCDHQSSERTMMFNRAMHPMAAIASRRLLGTATADCHVR